MGGLAMMRPTPTGKACANKAGVMVRVSMGRRVSHPLMASRGRRLGCLPRSLAIMCVVAVWASGSMSVQVYEATSWHALSTDSSPGAMPPHSSTKWMSLWRRMYLGMFYSGRWGGVSPV